MKLIDEKEVEEAAIECCLRDGYSDTYAAGKTSGFSEGVAFSEQKLHPMIIEFAEWIRENFEYTRTYSPSANSEGYVYDYEQKPYSKLPKIYHRLTTEQLLEQFLKN